MTCSFTYSKAYKKITKQFQDTCYIQEKRERSKEIADHSKKTI